MKLYTVIALDLTKVQELAKDLGFVKELRSKLDGGGKVDLPGVTHLATAEQEHYKHLRLAVQRIATASASQQATESRNGTTTSIELSFKKSNDTEQTAGHEVAVLWFFLDRLDELDEHAEAFGSDLAKLCEAGRPFTTIPGGLYVGRVDSHSPLLTELKSGELRSSKQEIDEAKARVKRPAPPAEEPEAEKSEEPAHAT